VAPKTKFQRLLNGAAKRENFQEPVYAEPRSRTDEPSAHPRHQMAVDYRKGQHLYMREFLTEGGRTI
jgi:hypothetical protein